MKKGNIKIDYKTKDFENKNMNMKESLRIDKDTNIYDILDFFFSFMERMGYNYYDFEDYISTWGHEIDKEMYKISLEESENINYIYDIPPVNDKVGTLIEDNTFLSNIKYQMSKDDNLSKSVITSYLNDFYKKERK